ncbi:LysR family transcriptional regulator [Pandoraea apista]|uniref:LysR family transcriptional regulator n=1 Tax=Pandoraea apista TaxID=93218 RepID=A0ABX9ZSC0_9BURK|nr:LysR family transcriptional regulator [Pandoraea apista]PTE02278.1 LysR family transcriptional regulator [Pandoraea apista]RRJ34666.1 LysR family transcriptional regulator [Pandoraea apista]RRJ80792.1 LysR family transcriptional regulator [Pandoraea apista]RRW96538.1 LysR family transcriptional regulator [Pandoraea apista]RRX02127.1 LysR family transcriptional regulator [Pandoraea apista]
MSVQKNTGRMPLESARLQWDDIRYFLELARVGSLSGAARQLSVEHSTVARRVEALEQSLGVRLFDRLPKGWSLTPEGETLAKQAARLDDEAQAFSRAAVGVSSLKGTVRLSAPPVLASHLLVPRLADIRARWSNIDLEVIGESRDANLARGEADLAIRLSRPTAPGLVARCIGKMGYGLYAADGYTARPPSEWEFLGYDESLDQVPQQRWLNQTAGDRRFVFRSNDLAALLHAARAGLGIAALPTFLAAQDPGLCLLTDHTCSTVRQLWLVMHPDVKRSPRVRLIADLLVELVSRTPELSLEAPEGLRAL